MSCQYASPRVPRFPGVCQEPLLFGQKGAAGTSCGADGRSPQADSSALAAFGTQAGSGRKCKAGGAPRSCEGRWSLAGRPSPRACRCRTLAGQFAPGPTPRAFRCKGAGAPGFWLPSRGGPGRGAFKPGRLPARDTRRLRALLRPPSPLRIPAGHDAVFLGSGGLVPAHLLQGQLVSRAGGGRRAAPRSSSPPGPQRRGPGATAAGRGTAGCRRTARLPRPTEPRLACWATEARGGWSGG